MIPVDSIGAGDTFGAAVVAWLHEHGAIRPDLYLEEKQLSAALDFACLAGAITRTHAGADPPWKWEMKGSRPPFGDSLSRDSGRGPG
jgi:fructokinase